MHKINQLVIIAIKTIMPGSVIQPPRGHWGGLLETGWSEEAARRR